MNFFSFSSLKGKTSHQNIFNLKLNRQKNKDIQPAPEKEKSVFHSSRLDISDFEMPCLLFLDPLTAWKKCSDKTHGEQLLEERLIIRVAVKFNTDVSQSQ